MKWLKNWAEKTPDNLFINDLSYREIYDSVLLKAAQLQNIKDIRVAFPMRNRADDLEILFALLALGKEVLLINPALTEAEKKTQIKPLRIDTVIDANNLPEGDFLDESSLAWDFNPEKIAVLMNTSATTGAFKTVPITWKMIEAQVKASAEMIGVEEEDNWLAVLPIFHVSGLSIIMRTLYNGTSATLVEKFDAEYVTGLINTGSINMASMVPTMLNRIIDNLEPLNLRMLLLGGEFIPQPLIENAFAKKIPIFKTYGMTETFSQSATFNILDAPNRLDSVGRALPGVEIKIENPDSDGAGNIWIKSPMLMKGYLNKPDLPSDGFDTADIGYLDNGYLYVLNRRRDIIISGGENIYPKEIENIVYGIDGVREAVLIPREDSKWGQIPILYYSGTVKSGDILEFLEGKISRFKMPKEIIYMDELPKNPSGKILRKNLQ